MEKMLWPLKVSPYAMCIYVYVYCIYLLCIVTIDLRGLTESCSHHSLEAKHACCSVGVV